MVKRSRSTDHLYRAHTRKLRGDSCRAEHPRAAGVSGLSVFRLSASARILSAIFERSSRADVGGVVSLSAVRQGDQLSAFFRVAVSACAGGDGGGVHGGEGGGCRGAAALGFVAKVLEGFCAMVEEVGGGGRDAFGPSSMERGSGFLGWDDRLLRRLGVGVARVVVGVWVGSLFLLSGAWLGAGIALSHGDGAAGAEVGFRLRHPI